MPALIPALAPFPIVTALLVTFSSAVIGKLTAPKGPQGPQPRKGMQGRSVTVRGTVEPRQLIYGEVRTGGVVVYTALSSANDGGEQKYLYFIIAAAGHQIDSFTEWTVDNVRVRAADITPPAFFYQGNVTLARFQSGGVSKLGIYSSKGNSSSEGAAVQSAISYHLPEWDSTHIGKGVAFWVVRLEYDATVWPTGVPQDFFAVVKGRKVYDPRLDSTNGGAGSHRLTDATTWAWSNNPALCVADYVTGGSILYDTATPNTKLGLGESTSRVPWSEVITEANVCDQTPAVPIPMLQGVMTWTNGSPVVTGIDSAFTYQLVAGNYVYGPNSTFYQVLSIQSDTQITLTANYGGSTATDTSNQYFTSATTTTTQKRYTCDAQLSCGDTHLDNMKTLLSSMFGFAPYGQGKYHIKALAYTAASIAITEDDVHGSFTLITHPDSQDNYNIVSGTFYDENRGWVLADFPPQTVSSYQTDDASVDVVQIDLHATRDYYRAQRMAYLHLLQGRNKTILKVTGLTGNGRKLKPLDVFTLPVGFYGLTTEEWRAEEVHIRSDGYVDVTARITNSASFTDLASGAYRLPDNSRAAGFSDSTNPSVPTGLTITAYPQLIVFVIGGTFTPDTSFELWEYTASTPFSSASLMYAGNSTRIVIPKRDTTTRYYWVRSKLNGTNSATYPASTGSGMAADLTQTGDLASNAATDVLVDTYASNTLIAGSGSGTGTPITRSFPAAGTYEITLTGRIDCIAFTTAGKANVWFSFSGSGVNSGDAHPQYDVTSNGQSIQISQSLTIECTGGGPWQISVLNQISTGTYTIVFSNQMMRTTFVKR